MGGQGADRARTSEPGPLHAQAQQQGADLVAVLKDRHVRPAAERLHAHRSAVCQTGLAVLTSLLLLCWSLQHSRPGPCAAY